MSGPRQAGSLLRKYRLIKHVPVTYGKQGVGAPRDGGELRFTHEQWYKSHPEISLLTCRAPSRGRGTFFLKCARFLTINFSHGAAAHEPSIKELPASTEQCGSNTLYLWFTSRVSINISFLFTVHVRGARSLGQESGPAQECETSQSVVPLFSWSSHANVLIDQQRQSPSERSASLQPLYRNSPGSPGSRSRTLSPIKGPCTVSRVRSLHSPSYFSVIPLSIMFFGEVERDGNAVWHLWPIWRSHNTALAGELFPAAGSFQAPRHHCGTFAVTRCSQRLRGEQGCEFQLQHRGWWLPTGGLQATYTC